MITSLDISTSGLIAQRERLTTISQNIANMSSLRDANNRLGPYRAKHVILETDNQMATTSGAAGVKVAEIRENDVEPRRRWEPNHPLAIKEGRWKGYVEYPNVDMTEQFVDALEATRAYESNVGVIEMTKNMTNQTLRILA
ncbi:flagellar basal body rod protein FlgC [Bremerella cremea]|uniref:Flagellar basal-body rod protein FlgC n=1 Tax=Bremerella cremea TaxID=1031537 RepID=A0A368KNG0_9BACT|nr:flagellar basal body rod protein FlgC [Bremerella cremea]RCS41382.1 flagellar basal body rod protein FlgC [Bremerella cremea]